jgi:integrase
MPILVRERTEGKHELRVTHALLAKPFYKTFDNPDEAERTGKRAIGELEKGKVPAWLVREKREGGTTVAEAIHSYGNIRAIPFSSEKLYETLSKEIGSTQLAELDYPWVERWITSLKRREGALAPGTIRKKKGALSRVLDWVLRAHPLWLDTNPLHALPHGYSGYDAYTREFLEAKGWPVPEDEERDRRIDRSEESRIVELFRLRREQASTLAEQAEAEGLSLMFQLALRSAMRMREIYTLSVTQVSPAAKTIFLDKTKNGDRRQVPMFPDCVELLARPWPALEAIRQCGRIFPFWDGRLAPEVLKETTYRVSRHFSIAFKEVQSADLHFHDSRHEAICRWVLEHPRPWTSEQLGRAAGMKDARTRQRYLSLRGSELADLFFS